MRILTVLGTRPEAIKLAPVILDLKKQADVEHAVCVTGQHREMLDSVLSIFGIVPEFDLDVMKSRQGLGYITTAVLEGVDNTISTFRPDWVIVQGDTTTAFAAALAAFYHKIPVAHVEAGLRTYNILSPWPEEMNRKLVGQLATMHFPPTEQAASNLSKEGIKAENILVTGNTVIDALHLIAERLDTDKDLEKSYDKKFDFLLPGKRLILVTGHRRENLNGGLNDVCRALAKISERDDVQIVYPVHLNPAVQDITDELLSDKSNVHLIAPQEYLPFIYLLRRAHIIVTDSGGIQEEAPGLGKPVLVTRDTTERPEAIEAGTAKLVGTDAKSIFAAINNLLDSPEAYSAMSKAQNPFGDGHAAKRITKCLVQKNVLVDDPQ